MNPVISIHAFVLGAGVENPLQPKAAIEFHLAPQWHIYWDNHGDSGMSTSADDAVLIYPTPQKIPLPGGLLSYGYEGRVVFFLENPKESIFIRWLACKDDTCIPGKKELLFEPAHVNRFQDDWNALPKDCPFVWQNPSENLSRVEARANSWMAPYSDLADSVQSQYQKDGAHYVQWNTKTPKGRYLWSSDSLSCIVQK